MSTPSGRRVRAASDRLLLLSDAGPDRRPSDLPCGHSTTAGVRTKLPPLGVRVAMRPALWPESGLASVARRLGSPVRGVSAGSAGPGDQDVLGQTSAASTF